jgi:hypothetical protein
MKEKLKREMVKEFENEFDNKIRDLEWRVKELEKENEDMKNQSFEYKKSIRTEIE